MIAKLILFFHRYDSRLQIKFISKKYELYKNDNNSNITERLFTKEDICFEDDAK